MKIILLLLGITLAIALLSVGTVARMLFGSAETDNSPRLKEQVYGPFVIQSETRNSSFFNVNLGRISNEISLYTVCLQGQRITLDGDSESGQSPLNWVAVLPDAPVPTLIGGNTSIYLIRMEGDNLRVEKLFDREGRPDDRMYWLDSPGQDIRMPDTMPETIPALTGGRYLMFGNILFLDTHTLRFRSIISRMRKVDSYGFGFNDDRVFAFSPDRKSIVFHAGKSPWSFTEPLDSVEPAMVVVQTESGEAYAIPYSPVDTRLANPYFADSTWFDTFFDWKNDPAGNDRLHLKQVKPAVPWVGKFDKHYYGYNLAPVSASMIPVFTRFVLRYKNWSQEQVLEETVGEYSGPQLILGPGRALYSLTYYAAEHRLLLVNSAGLADYADPAHERDLRAIGAAFDAELRTGKYHEHFLMQ